ncbi:MAG: 5'/3'-nucleotidase SurE [Proteobacteria bacterium]|nr:5'/3'-nucleotidase SurE [Pseudomonadota bacterium]
MNILITNDDGVNAEGLKILYDLLKYKNNVFILVPDRERSASSHSLTLNIPLKLNKIEKNIYTINGMPTDCVLIALNGIFKDVGIDVVLSGINHGPNLGEDVLYSGTVAAAFEAVMWGIPGISFSLASFENPDFSGVKKYFEPIFYKLYDKIKENDAVMNINFPNVPADEIKGIKFTKLGTRKYDDAIIKVNDPRGNDYYWIGGHKPDWKKEKGSDYDAVFNNYISITPLKIDLTDYEFLNTIEREISFEL